MLSGVTALATAPRRFRGPIWEMLALSGKNLASQDRFRIHVRILRPWVRRLSRARNRNHVIHSNPHVFVMAVTDLS
jgi:hypothetical protein